MNEQIRRPEPISPKSSPRGSRSPAYPRPDSSGTLKTTIQLGKIPSVIHTGPFYLMKDIPVQKLMTEKDNKITGCTNLLEVYDLEHTYNKFCNKSNKKEELSSFLPTLPGYIDTPGHQDNSSLRSLIEKPPITGKEISTLSNSSLAGFRLHPGPLPDQYKFMSQMPPKKGRHNKHKRKRESSMNGSLQETSENTADSGHEKPKHRKTTKGVEEAVKDSTGKKDRESGRKKNKKKKKKGKDKDEDPQS